FFFQAEDGIRDFHVTGVQTCALPIFLTGYDFVLASARLHRLPDPTAAARRAVDLVDMTAAQHRRIGTYSKGMRQRIRLAAALVRSEERRVGKESRARWGAWQCRSKRE